jgi:hypothetical protein
MKWAIVTPSYKLDYDQCVLMCESVDAFVQGDWHHYIIVNKVDLQLFSHLTSSRRTVLLNSDVLPPWLHYIGKLGKVRSGSMWFSWRTGIIFGWHLQQITKMSMASYLKEDVLLIIDSDIIVAREIKLDNFKTEEGLRICRTSAKNLEPGNPLIKFNVSSQLTLGLPSTTEHMNYCHPAVIWHRQTVLELCDYICQRHKKHWVAAIYGYRLLSEGTLYGLYVDHLVHARNFFTKDEYIIVKGFPLDPVPNEQAIENYLGNCEQNEYMLVVPSVMQYDVNILRRVFKKFLSNTSNRAKI